MRKSKISNIEELEFQNENQKKTAIELAKILEQSGLTQRQMAEKADISLATLTNCFRVSYGKPLTINAILKIANQTEYPEETYNRLMKAAGHDLFKYPYNPNQFNLKELAQRTTTIGLDRDFSIIFRFMDRIKSVYDREVVLGKLSGLGIPRLATIDFSSSDMPINEWDIEFHTGFGFPKPTVNEFLYRILKEGKKNVKYSFVTNSESVYDELASFNIDTLINGIYISVIICRDGKFTETYMTNNQSELDEVGLSI